MVFRYECQNCGLFWKSPNFFNLLLHVLSSCRLLLLKLWQKQQLTESSIANGLQVWVPSPHFFNLLLYVLSSCRLLLLNLCLCLSFKLNSTYLFVLRSTTTTTTHRMKDSKWSSGMSAKTVDFSGKVQIFFNLLVYVLSSCRLLLLNLWQKQQLTELSIANGLQVWVPSPHF